MAACFTGHLLRGSVFEWERSNPTADAGKVGLDKDSGLHISPALALTPAMNLFNWRVRERHAGLARADLFWNTPAIVATPRLMVSRLFGATESAQAGL
jgi:hypothetical protein